MKGEHSFFRPSCRCLGRYRPRPPAAKDFHRKKKNGEMLIERFFFEDKYFSFFLFLGFCGKRRVWNSRSENPEKTGRKYPSIPSYVPSTHKKHLDLISSTTSFSRMRRHPFLKKKDCKKLCARSQLSNFHHVRPCLISIHYLEMGDVRVTWAQKGALQSRRPFEKGLGRAWIISRRLAAQAGGGRGKDFATSQKERGIRRISNTIKKSQDAIFFKHLDKSYKSLKIFFFCVYVKLYFPFIIQPRSTVRVKKDS